MASHNKKGKEGEDRAAKYLSESGYKIIRRNWRYKHKEIDILAYHDNKLIVVEVKTRSTADFGDPSEAVTIRKQRYLIEAAEAYLNTIDEEPEVRFDIVSIIDENGRMAIEHIEDAFNPF